MQYYVADGSAAGRHWPATTAAVAWAATVTARAGSESDVGAAESLSHGHRDRDWPGTAPSGPGRALAP